MSRSELQTALNPCTQALLAARCLTIGAAAGAAVCFLFLSFIIVFQGPGDGQFGPRDAIVMLSAATLLTSVAFLAGFSRKLLSAVLKKAWDDHYAGSRWKTPAGEIGSFVGSTDIGTRLFLKFAKDDLDDLAIDDLVSLDGRDMSSISSWSLAASATLFALLLVLGAVLVVHGANVGGILAGVCAAVGIGTFVAGASFFFYPQPYRSARSERLHQLSVCEWKTLDGRIGRVRHVRPGYEDIDDRLTVVFPDGSKIKTDKRDLIPVIAETANPAEIAA